MNNKKIQAQMQINVSFLGDTTKLVKQLQDTTKHLNLEGSFTKQLGTNLTKGFKEVYSNIEKMSDGLSKKGLSSKQYVSFFNEMNGKLKESIKFTANLKKELQEAFNSQENKQALKDLEKYKKQLEEIHKLSASRKGASTRQDTATRKMLEETGIDYNIAKRTLSGIASRKANNLELTKGQKDWAAANGLDEAKLKRVLELLKQINAQSNKQKELNDKAKELTGQGGIDASTNFLEKQIKQLSGNVITPEMNKQNMVVATTIEQLSDNLGEVVDNQIPQFKVGLEQSEIEAQKLAAAGSTLNEIFAQFGISFSIASILKGLQDLVVESFNFYKSLDSALNEIYVVSNLTSGAVDGLTTQFINMSKKTGMALDDVTRSAVLFYQQGLNTDEVMEMTEVTSQFAKVAGIDATDAADKLTAAVNGYCLAAEDASLVADKFNKVAAASAADINELSTAFSKAAAQANQAGVSMDNYLAYIATMVEATREAPENIGTSLKTIMSRMQQVKEGGTTEDGETDVNQVETALKSVGVALRDTKGELRDLEDVFAELGPKWQSLDRNTQAYLGTIIAGTRQQSRFITLMQNWDRVLDLADQSANSAGQQALMHAKAMDSIESKVQQFQVAWQEFISNLTESDVIKGAVTALTKLLDIFNDGNKPVALLAAGIGLLATKMKDLQGPLVTKVKDMFTNLKAGVGIGTGNFFTSDGERALALEKNKEAQFLNEQQMNVALEQQKIILTQIAELEQKQTAEGTIQEQDQQELNTLKERELQLQRDINNAKKHGEKLIKEEKRITNAPITTKGKAFGQAASMIGMGLTAAGMAIGQKDDNAGGVVSSVGSVVSSIGQFATGNWIGGIMSAATSIYQISQTVENWDENIKARVEESVTAVGDALGNVNNLGTGIKSTEELLKNYDKLSRKMHKTQAEQEELNTVVQQLGDTYGVDVLSDAYGNLSLNIAEVRAELELQKAEQEEMMSELAQTEQESMDKALSGLGNDTKMSEYLDKMFSANASDYKTLLSGIEDGLSDESRNVSENVAKAFSSNLKSSITNEVRNNADEYIVDGFANSIVGIEDALNEGVDSTTWNELYARIDFLEKNINDMSYADAQEYLQQFYDKWGQHNDAIKENWDIIVDAINNTVFDNQSLLNFFKEVEELQKKGDKTYWKNDEGTGKLDVLESQLRSSFDSYNSKVGALNKSGAVGWGADAFTGLNGEEAGSFEAFKKNLDSGQESNFNNWFQNIFRLKDGDNAALELDNLAKAYQEAKEEMDEFYQSYADEHGLESAEDAKLYIEALGTLSTALEKVTGNTQDYMNSIEELYNTEGMSGAEASQHAAAVKQVAEGMSAMGSDATDADRYNYLATYYEHNKDSMKDGVKEQWEKILKEAFSELEVATPRTLTEIAKELDTIGSDLVKMNDIVAEFNETGGMTLDTFTELAGIIDGINLDDLGSLDPSAVDSYINAIDNLNLAYDENTGNITMNGDALTSLQKIQELQTKSKLASMIADLKASKATTETQIAYIDAQIAATDAAIRAAQLDSQNSITAADIKSQANSAFQTSFDTSMEKITGSYENDATNQGQWSTTILSNLGTVADAWSKYFTGIRTGSTTSLDSIKNAAKNILKDADYKWEGESGYSGINWDEYDTITKGSDAQKKLLEDLNAYKTSLENTKKSYQATLDLTNKEIALLENMYNSDLSKLGVSADKAGEELDQYIGKLKEIYNILNRIQNLEHRLSTLDTYSNVAEGDQYGDYLRQRIGLNEELLDQYEFLVTEQKKFTNGYKDFIESSAVADVFDFDEFGQIIIDFEKYNKLQDTAKDGEKSLKEQADELYDTYTSMYDELQGYFDEYIAYLEQTIDLNQEIVDAYVDIEKQAADAIKEIYQDMLDTKLEAIDKEKEALEELQEARERARTDQQNAEDISNLQTNIQRSMMDSSGASDISFIKAQNDMNDKLEEIADDKYSEMLDNIIERLEQEQDALQENFDEMFDNLDWLHQAIEEDMMTNEERLLELFQQTDEWKQLTSAERKQQVDEWSTQMATYMETIQGGKTIMDVCTYIDQLQQKTIQLDEALKTQISNTGIQVANAVKDGIQSAYSKGYNAGGGGGGGYTGGSGGGGNPGGGGQNPKIDEVPDVPELTPRYTSAYAIGDTLSTKEAGWLDFVTQYDLKDGKMVKDLAVIGARAQNKVVTDVQFYNGQFYYLLKGLDGYIKGAQLNQVKKGSGKPLQIYKHGGFVDTTGPAWLDGTISKPEAVLNALQTEHFIKFTNALDNMFSNGNIANTSSTVSIDTISFNVESMSSPEDGEAAFNMFVNKFKEIGSQSGIKIDSFKNRL